MNSSPTPPNETYLSGIFHNCRRSPLGGVPLGGVPLGGVPLGGVPLGGVPLGVRPYVKQKISAIIVLRISSGVCRVDGGAFLQQEPHCVYTIGTKKQQHRRSECNCRYLRFPSQSDSKTKRATKTFQPAWDRFHVFRARHRLHVFSHLAPVACLPARRVGCTFSRAWHRLHVFPRLAQVTCLTELAVSFPAHGAACMFLEMT